MPVYLLLDMPYDELLGWNEFFSQRPVGWREDSRTFTLLRAQGVKARPYEIFSSLVPIYKDNTPSIVNGYMSTETLKKSSIFQKLVSSIDGDNATKEVLLDDKDNGV